MGEKVFSLEDFESINWDVFSSNEKEENANIPPKKFETVINRPVNVEKIDKNEDLLKKEEEEVRLQIAAEVRRILNKKKSEENKDNFQKKPKEGRKIRRVKENTKKKINKPKTKNYRYTAPKERGIIARIINRMKYENDWYEDVEDYLYDNYDYATAEIEQSRMAEKRREQRLYKRVQAYEDARDDVTMKKAFIGMKVTAIATLLAASGFAANLLINQINDIVNSGYVSQEQEKPKLANASEGQIQYAENVLSRIEYDFEHLSHTELLDTVIRSGSKVNDINENRARSAAKDFLNFSDQKLLESILQEAYEDEYNNFSDEKKLELNQLLYEMLDEEAKFWIRSPEKVAEIKSRNETKNEETTEMELD